MFDQILVILQQFILLTLLVLFYHYIYY